MILIDWIEAVTHKLTLCIADFVEYRLVAWSSERKAQEPNSSTGQVKDDRFNARRVIQLLRVLLRHL